MATLRLNASTWSAARMEFLFAYRDRDVECVGSLREERAHTFSAPPASSPLPAIALYGTRVPTDSSPQSYPAPPSLRTPFTPQSNGPCSTRVLAHVSPGRPFKIPCSTRRTRR